MKGVILAAGFGSRLARHHSVKHKVLLPVAGRPIIDYTLEAFAESGINHIAIITGHQGEYLERWVGDGSRYGLNVQFIFNPHYRMGNALSVYAARHFSKTEPIILSMADHMVSPDLLSRVHESQGHESVLAVDFDEIERDEATRVFVDPEGLVTRIGKGLSRWNGIDAGVFRLALPIYDSIAELVREERVEYELGEAVARMLGKGHPLQACDISGCFWRDIDTWDDLQDAREVLARENHWP
jgi:choline kinase